jgi:DNA topoisomerase-2
MIVDENVDNRPSSFKGKLNGSSSLSAGASSVSGNGALVFPSKAPLKNSSSNSLDIGSGTVNAMNLGGTSPDKKPKPAKKAAGGNGKSIEEMYTKKTQLEHILLRPDTYIGSIEKQTANLWVFDQSTQRVVNRPVSYVPGLYKIFDEIIVNASDNKQRDATMNRINVDINPSENSIKVWNNGNGIPIAIHQEHQIYVPELIFGNLLTGSNFDDAEEKTTGGSNGYGANLANIFSQMFVVETADCSRGLKYKQVFRNNMSVKLDPEITKHTGTDYTCITFYPDLARFKMDSLDEDIVSLLSKRAYDMAGSVISNGQKLSVYLNGQKLSVKDFESYIGLYDGIEKPVAFEKVNEQWEIGVGISDGSFQQVRYMYIYIYICVC